MNNNSNDGKYRVLFDQAASPGTYTVKIQKQGYESKSVNFTLPDVSSWSDERIWSEKPGMIDLGTIVLKKL